MQICDLNRPQSKGLERFLSWREACRAALVIISRPLLLMCRETNRNRTASEPAFGATSLGDARGRGRISYPYSPGGGGGGPPPPKRGHQHADLGVFVQLG